MNVYVHVYVCVCAVCALGCRFQPTTSFFFILFVCRIVYFSIHSRLYFDSCRLSNTHKYGLRKPYVCDAKRSTVSGSRKLNDEFDRSECAYDVIFELVEPFEFVAVVFFCCWFSINLCHTHTRARIQCNNAVDYDSAVCATSSACVSLCLRVYVECAEIDVDGSKATSFTCTLGRPHVCHFMSRLCMSDVGALCCGIVSHSPLSIHLSDNNNFKPRCKRALTELINNIVQRCTKSEERRTVFGRAI